MSAERCYSPRIDQPDGAAHSKERSWGEMIYAAFSERDMKDLSGDLERAKSSLQLAYMMYLDLEQRGETRQTAICSLTIA